MSLDLSWEDVKMPVETLPEEERFQKVKDCIARGILPDNPDPNPQPSSALSGHTCTVCEDPHPQQELSWSDRKAQLCTKCFRMWFLYVKSRFQNPRTGLPF